MISETQRLVWMPFWAEMNNATQVFFGVTYNSSEQNKDSTKERQERDTKDTTNLLEFLSESNPFSSDPSLHSIASGITSDSTSNVDNAKAIGEAVLESMT